MVLSTHTTHTTHTNFQTTIMSVNRIAYETQDLPYISPSEFEI
jgi:hypothetical protein